MDLLAPPSNDDSALAEVQVAYFSMEIALESAMPTYSGGLGVLAGDYLRAAADSEIPIIGVTLLYRKGYFRQRLDNLGNQREEPNVWSPEDFLEPLPQRSSVTIEGRTVVIRPWRYVIKGVQGFKVPVYLLDTDLPENASWDRTLTDSLYGGDNRYRLCQEVVLGLGGAAVLRALGYPPIPSYHMNEGHSALLGIAVLEQEMGGRPATAATPEDIHAARRHCVFTTHTPVPAGIDKFPRPLVKQVLGEQLAEALENFGCCLDGLLNMTYLALTFSHYVNGVSMRHEAIAHSMFPNYPMNAITNGVHAATWASPPFQRLFDQYLPQWRNDNLYLRYAVSIPLREIQEAHVDAKHMLLAEVERRIGEHLDPRIMTIGFARRATIYKRANLLFSNLNRLKRIAAQAGPLQIVFGGKAHPRDDGGKDQIRRVFRAAEELRGIISVVYLEEYDLDLGRFLCAGSDLWLNTPQKPQEASGTSGMKAAINGVPSLSILDGWWIEGNVEGVTGWAIGDDSQADVDPAGLVESTSLYDKLEYIILPMFYKRPEDYSAIRRSAIALNGSFYNAERMALQYVENAYQPSTPIADG